MSTLALAVALDGPLPEPPEYSLLTTPGVLRPNADADLDGVMGGLPRWVGGATIYGYPEDPPSLWDPVDTGTQRVKDDTDTISYPTFGSFVFYVPISGSAFEIAGDPEGYAARARAVLDATESWAVEHVLSQGLGGGWASPFFLDGNETVLAAGVAQTPSTGVAYLEEALALSGRRGLIHLTPGALSKDGFQKVVHENGGIHTATGQTIVNGQGYVGAHRLGHTVAAPQSWAFATGPVHVKLGDWPDSPIREALDRSTNDVVFRAERYALAYWDTAVQYAVLIDWST